LIIPLKAIGAVNKTELIDCLDSHLNNVQPSERWAMYRLITPVVDYANQRLNFTPYFEFNQTSEHGTHQSVDIALLDEDGQPQVFIEAKRADRKLSPEQIDKYLNNKTRGVVTNGLIWLLCETGCHEPVVVFSNKLNKRALDRVISFIRGNLILDSEGNKPSDIYRSKVKLLKSKKQTKASRKVHPKQTVATTTEFQDFINGTDDRPSNELAFLKAINNSITSDRLSKIKIVTRKTRVGFFDLSLPKRQQRVARIELGKTQPDVLVRTEIVAINPALSEIATPMIHDKGAHMRRFRLGTEDQSAKFGSALMKALK
jgi:hypothetical protein